jgi:predicted DNA-binding transcriptional regulator YafY
VTHFYRRDATHKVLGLLRLLLDLRQETQKGHVFDVEVFGERNGVSARTVRRHLNHLKDEEWVDYDPVKRSWHLTAQADTLTITPLALSLEEGVALGAARALITPLSSLPTGQEDILQTVLRRTFDRLLAALPQNVQSRATEMERAVRTVPAAVTTLHIPLSEFVEAISEKQTLDVLYESLSSKAAAPSWRRIDPYEIEEDVDRRRFFLHGWCHRNQAIRTFALERVSEIGVTEQTFSRRDAEWEAFAAVTGIVGGLRGFDPVPVDVRFSPEVAVYALRYSWPDGLTIVPEENGGARLTGTAQGTEGILREVLRWRRHAHVVGGSELLEAMREEIDAIRSLYG